MGILDRAVVRTGELIDLWRARPRGLRPIEPTLPNRTGWPLWGAQWGDTYLPYMTEPVVLGIPAARRAVRLIANGVASMSPPRVVKADRVTEAPGPWPVVDRPNAGYGPYEFWHEAVCHLITSGNFVGLYADPDPLTGYPRQVVPVNTSMVRGYFDDDGFARYDIGDALGLAPDDLVHIRAHSVPGQIMGIGVVEAFRRELGEIADGQNFAAATYRSGAVPSGVVEIPAQDPSTEQTDAVQERWVERHGAGARKPAVFGQGWKFTAIQWSPGDLEFLESRKFSVAEIAFMFDLDPSDLGASIGESMTYANLSQRQAGRVVDGFGQWIARTEDAWSDLLPGGNLVRFRRENYLHASRKELFEEQAVGIKAGVLLVDEAREELNKAPIPKAERPEPPLEVESQTGDPLELEAAS